MTNFSLFDQNRPHEGATISGKELRDLLVANGTFNAGTTSPGSDAILIGDVQFVKILANPQYNLSLVINGVSKTIDVRTTAGSDLQTTPTSVVAAINQAYAAMGTVAYVYNPSAYDSSAFVAIVAPRIFNGTPTIVVNELTDGTDISLKVLGLQGRGVGMPYTVSASAIPYGMSWLKVQNGDDDSLSIYMGSPARATGLLDISRGTGTLNLSQYGYMRVKIVTPTATFGPLTVNVQGASPSATTPEEIASAINAAFIAAPGWPSATGPAQLVARNGVGKYLQIVSGPVDNPSKGVNAFVELSGLAIGGTLGINFLVDDAITLTMGFSRGEAGKVFGRIPHVFTGQNFTDAFVRGLGNRSGPGIGMWGPALESSIDIPTTGVVDGEVRVAKDSGIPWIYRQGQNGLSGSGWRRMIPGNTYPLTYDKAAESIKLSSTNDTFVPQPLSRVSHNISLPYPSTVIDANNKQTGRIGDALTLVDARDFLWQDLAYTDNRTPYDTPALYDNFPTAQYRLGRSREGAQWLVSDPNTPTITGTNSQRLRPMGSNIARTDATQGNGFDAGAIRAYLDGTGNTRFQSYTGSSSAAVFTIPGTGAGTNPVKGKSFSIRLVGAGTADPATNDTSGVLAYRGYDNGSGVIGGVGITGTIDYNTGAVSVTFGASISWSAYRVCYNFCQSDLNIVSVDVRKNPGFEARAGGTAAQAGVIYSAQSTGSTIDTGSGFAVIVRDDGVGTIYSLAGGTATGLSGFGAGGSFLVDPPLDTTWRTLRVVYATDGSNMIHAVFWNGSNKPCDWVTKDYAQPDGNLTPGQTNGGAEIERTSKLVALATVPFNGNPNQVGYYSGLWARGVNASGGYVEKVVEFKNFQNHTGHLRSYLDPLPCLPPVSATRLRDTINAIALRKNGVDTGRIITDCTAENPLIIDIGHDLANAASVIDSSSGVTGRKLTLDLDVAQILTVRDGRYLPVTLAIPGNSGAFGINTGGTDTVNLLGREAFWSISDVLANAGGAGWAASTPGAGLPYRFSKLRSDPPVNALVANQNGYWGPLSGGGFGVVFDLGEGWSWTGTNGLARKQVRTLLPYNGGSVKWRYEVVRAQVSHEYSPYRFNNGIGTWTNANDYLVPHVSAVQYSNTQLYAPWATFDVEIQYNGPVRPTSLFLDIRAVRVGTTT